MVFKYKIVLASSSPRRIQLMRELGLDFIHVSPEGEEDNLSSDPVKRVEINSVRKAESVQNQHPDSLIIGSDTVVSLGGEIMGKPVDSANAERMLGDLSGNCNLVYTGVSVLDTRSGKRMTCHASTKVWFKQIADERIREYVRSGEPLDKAGAYGIQGLGGELVDRIEGSYSNVVGLPVDLLADMLREFGVDLKNSSTPV